MRCGCLSLILTLELVSAVSCGTVAPKTTGQAQASFDPTPDAKGNYQNSGILGFTNQLAIVTPNARGRYNALVIRYGTRFMPETKQDDGLKPFGTNLWTMDKFHLSQFATMSQWARLPELKKNQ